MARGKAAAQPTLLQPAKSSLVPLLPLLLPTLLLLKPLLLLLTSQMATLGLTPTQPGTNGVARPPFEPAPTYMKAPPLRNAPDPSPPPFRGPWGPQGPKKDFLGPGP